MSKIEKIKNFLKTENGETFLYAIKSFISILIVYKFFLAPFLVYWNSMQSSYYNEEFVIVDKFSYVVWKPNRGDVVVLKPQVNNKKEYFLKRVIWLPWEELKIENWEVFIKRKIDKNFIKLDEKYLNSESKWKTFVWSDSWTYIYKIPENKYFVIWDNRNHSTDSRECFYVCWNWRDEFVDEDYILWKIFLDLWFFNFRNFSFVDKYWQDKSPRFFNTKSSHIYEELK